MEKLCELENPISMSGKCLWVELCPLKVEVLILSQNGSLLRNSVSTDTIKLKWGHAGER